MSLKVLVTPMMDDNYCYYIYKGDDINNGIMVDASEISKAEAFLKAYNIPTLKHLFTTHKHWDHSGANHELKLRFPELQVFGGKDDNVPACTVPLEDGAAMEVGGMHIRCFHVPCHTRGHILYYVTPEKDTDVPILEQEVFSVERKEGNYREISNINRCVFTGDTVFIGGCGKFFEGNADGMLRAMDVMAGLPLDTKIFCGHEYTVRNLEFCQKVNPGNPYIEKKMKEAIGLMQEGKGTVPSVLREERLYNVFMRCRDDPAIQEVTGTQNPAQCMNFLREYKNQGSKPHL